MDGLLRDNRRMAVPRAAVGVAAAGLAAGLPLIPIGLATDDVEPRGVWAVWKDW